MLRAAGRHEKGAGRHEKGAGRRALQKKPRQNTVYECLNLIPIMNRFPNRRKVLPGHLPPCSVSSLSFPCDRASCRVSELLQSPRNNGLYVKLQ